MTRIRLIAIELATQAGLALAIGLTVSMLLVGAALLLAGSLQA